MDRRYFPMFWDYSTGYLAVDLKNTRAAVALLDPESAELATLAYSSFELFLDDAISANEENRPLTCFSIR